MRYTRFRLPAVALLVAALFTQGHGQVAIPDPAQKFQQRRFRFQLRSTRRRPGHRNWRSRSGACGMVCGQDATLLDRLVTPLEYHS
jgi:hypothetical protein